MAVHDQLRARTQVIINFPHAQRSGNTCADEVVLIAVEWFGVCATQHARWSSPKIKAINKKRPRARSHISQIIIRKTSPEQKTFERAR